jgi:hypothetical protein
MIRRILLVLALLYCAPAFAGAWDPMGPTGGAPSPVGPQGDPGCSVLPTAGAPSPSLGQLCDWAFDASQGAVYGPKSAQGWGAPVIMTPVQIAQTAASQASQAASVAQVASASAAASAASASSAAAEVAALLAQGNTFVTPQSIIAPATPGAIIAAGSMLTVQNDPSVSNTTIYNPGVPSGWYTYDVAKFTLHLTSGSLALNAEALGLFVLNDTPQVINTSCPGGCGNAVAAFGVIISNVDGAASWGLNLALSDCLSPSCSVTDIIGRILAALELDLSVHANKTIVQAIGLMGSTTHQPAGADGFTCSYLGTPGAYFWSHCFVVDDGAAIIGLYLGAQSFGANSPSSVLDLAYYDASGAGQAISIQSINSGLNFFSTQAVGGTAPAGFAIALIPGNVILEASGSGDANLVLAALGGGVVILANTTFPSATGTISLGDPAYVFANIYTNQITFGSTATQTSGTADPTGIIEPVGSIYQRVGAAAGSRLCISAGGGSWNCLSGI